jgi:iron complex outermembrane receptor protein
MPLTPALDLTLYYRWHDRMGSYTDTQGQVQSYHPYSVVDARLAWNADAYSLYVEANNLTAYRYVDYGNVPQPGLWLKVGAKYYIDLF